MAPCVAAAPARKAAAINELTQCMRLLAGAWTAHVIWYLGEGERCFTELQVDIDGVSAKMLANRLHKLEAVGAIERITRRTSPPTVWYSLTPVGQELCASLTNLIGIAQRLQSRMGRSASSELNPAPPKNRSVSGKGTGAS